MNIFTNQSQLLKTIYPEHIWIDVVGGASPTQNLHDPDVRKYLQAINEHLTESLNLVVTPVFPSEESTLLFTSKLANGFALSVAGIKIAFILNQNLDLMGFEVPREWVELSNWIADYYVPVQVDIEHNCLHLWGFISHQYLCQRTTLDLDSHSYDVDAVDLISDLDSLWTTCDLVTRQVIPRERGEISSLLPFADVDARKLIDQLKQHRSLSVSGRESIFSPRLGLPFAQWGAILNSPEYLKIYVEPELVITQLTSWFQAQVNSIEQTKKKLVEAIGQELHKKEWLSISEFDDRSVALSGYFAESTQSKFKLRGIVPTNDREIHQIVKNLYANQNPAQKIDLPEQIESPLLLLVYLIHHTNDETLRWQAAEYLWTIDPTNSHTYQRKIKDLGLVMQGYKLGLMVAAIPLLNGTYSVLNRIYAIGDRDYLPAQVGLTLSTASGEQLYRVESRSTVTDRYIQLYFTASVGDRFNIGVEMNDARIVEAFAI
jgi:Protein of unknown function (DUF1822)